jgi:hypothetical protein
MKPLAIKLLHGSALVASALACSFMAAEPITSATEELDRLKSDYLACERTASLRRMSGHEMERCSVTAEALLQRGFAGDLSRLLVWWRAQKFAPANRTE